MSDFLEFEDTKETEKKDKWKVLVVDDEEDVHRITRLVLRDVEFDGKGIEVISAYSAEEAKEILSKEKDIALAIIDVVMEDTSAGLDLVRYIRDVLKNKRIRLAIRTGQPGYAPRKEVILEYDINDYREKTELSSEALISLVITSLRSYRDIGQLEDERDMIANVVKTIVEPTTDSDLKLLVIKLFEGMRKFLESRGIVMNGVVEIEGENIGIGFNPPSPSSIPNLEDRIRWENSKVFFTFRQSGKVVGKGFLVFENFDRRWKDLINLYVLNLLNLIDKNMVESKFTTTMYEMIFTLGDVIESRSEETGEHVKRVAHISYIMAKLLGFNEEEAQTIKLASMLHDVGKIGIPDQILNKPGKLTPDEFEVMKTHTIIGYRILKSSSNEVFKKAALIALHHHEQWAGEGYPKGLAGEEIPLCARIVSITDSYDALRSDRVYRPAWPERKVVEYLKEMSGTKYDPHLIEIFMKNYADFRQIYS